MNFLYPSFLWGLFAVAIPIFIHLFDLQRPRKVAFTNVKFLKSVKENTNRQLKLKHYLVLLSRILFIIFLVLAFAQPYIDKDNSHSNETAHVGIYLDNSYSMQNEIAQKPLLSSAIENIERIVSLFPPDTRYYFLDNNFRGKDQYATNGERLLDRLTEIEFSPNYRKAKNVFERQIANISNKTSSENKHLFYISDFQKSTIGNTGAVEPDTTFKVNMLPVTNRKVSNVYIDSIWLSNPFIKPNDNNELNIKVANSGNASVNNLKVKFVIDDNQISSASVNAQPNTSVTTRMNFSISGKGYKQCRLELEDYPVTFDNTYYFTLQVAPEIKIHTIGAVTDKVLQNVYANETIFDVTQSTFGNVTINKLESADVVIVEGIDKLDPSFWDNLHDFVKAGGHLLLFPSEKPETEKLREFSGNLKLPQINMSEEAANPDSLMNEKYGLQPPDKANPFFTNIFNEVDEKMNMPNSIPVISWTGGGTDILSFKTGRPFISNFGFQKGSIYLCSTPLSKNYTNFYKHSLFVPVMYKIAILSSSQNQQLAYSFQDKNISAEIENIFADKVYTLKNKESKFIPPQNIRGNQLIFEVPRNKMKAGFYELVSNENEQNIKTLAFNYGEKESLLEFYKRETLASGIGSRKNVQIFDGTDSASFANEYTAASISLNLWKHCLILSLVFLLAEILLLRLWK